MRTNWEIPVWDLLKLAEVGSAPRRYAFLWESLFCQLPSEATQRSPTEETGDQTAYQLYSETQERSQEVTSSSGEENEAVSSFHTLHVGGIGRSATYRGCFTRARVEKCSRGQR